MDPRGTGAGEKRTCEEVCRSGEGIDAPGVTGGLAGDGAEPAPPRAARRARRRLLICKKTT